ncbi:MAG: DUF3459 domain-containing protein, partial [Myxococcales bacterium]|nr:DUF3459 domain-containing protein [Myxococcales bacterium]
GIDVASQRTDPSSLWSLYRDLVALRKSQPALSDGEAAIPTRTGGGRGVTGLLRTKGESRVLYVVNFNGQETSGEVSFEVPGTARILYSDGDVSGISSDGGKVTLGDVGPRAFVFIALD